VRLLLRAGVSEELIASIIKVKEISELGTTLAVTSLLVTANVVPSSLISFTLMMEAMSSSETLVFTRVTRRKIPEDGILHGFICFAYNHDKLQIFKISSSTRFALEVEFPSITNT
jgi:hypothetical protein